MLKQRTRTRVTVFHVTLPMEQVRGSRAAAADSSFIAVPASQGMLIPVVAGDNAVLLVSAWRGMEGAKQNQPHLLALATANEFVRGLLLATSEKDQKIASGAPTALTQNSLDAEQPRRRTASM